MKNNSRNTQIGIFDSGLGGLSVWSEVVRLMPNQPTLYYADAANCPYGGKNADEIYRYTEEGVKWLMRHGAKIIIIACNTATGAAIEKLRANYPSIPFIGMEPAIKKAVEKTTTGVIGILATKFTLKSNKYLNTKNKYANECKVIEQAGEGLVELVEEDRIYSTEARLLLEKYLQPMIEEGVDTIVMGCTHYPFYNEIVKEITGGKIDIINPAPYVIKHTMDVMAKHKIEPGIVNNYRFHSSKSAMHSRYIRKRALSIIDNSI